MKNYISAVLLVLSVLISAQVSATTITIISRDNPGEGLGSTRSVSPVPGNNATTLGGQFFNVFRAASDFWEDRIDSNIPILFDVQLDPLPCSATSGTLGAAGPLAGFINFANAPASNTIYVVAQANSLAGFDLDPGFSDLSATFNSNLGTPGCLTGLSWWLGIDSPAPPGTISLFDTVLHEIAHGIGFLSLVDSNGVRFFDLNDAYMLNLFDRSQNLPWALMSNGQRAASTVNSGGLVWSGSSVAQGAEVITEGRNGGSLRMFAPNPFQPGSSVSHWDTALSPDELMEPFATQTSNSCATILALSDMGWRIGTTEDICQINSPVLAPIYLLLNKEEEE